MRLRTYFLAGLALIASAALVVNAQVPGVNSTLNSVFTLAYDNSTMKPTYSASADITLAAMATDVCTLTGSATRNVRVRRVLLTGTANAVSNNITAIVKRSSANSGGTATTPTVVPYDSVRSLGGAQAATAVLRAYTVNPTLGTAVGNAAEALINFGDATTGPVQGITEFKFGELGSPIVLRGTAQVMSVHMGSQTITSGRLVCTIEWTEE